MEETDNSDYEGDMEDVEDPARFFSPARCPECVSRPQLENDLAIRSLKKWLKVMEENIEPVSVSLTRDWSHSVRRERLSHIKGLSAEIEERGKEIRSLGSACQESGGQARRVRRLDRRWREVWLRWFEWQCLLEQQGPLDIQEVTSSDSLDSESDSAMSPPEEAEEPPTHVDRLQKMEAKPEVHLKCVVRGTRTSRTVEKSLVSKQKSSKTRQENSYQSQESEHEHISLNTMAFARDSETMIVSEEAISDNVENISDFWDKETYLSEYNYDEPIDVETAKKLLNFGDDYRNFMDSHSETLLSPRQPVLAPRRKRSQKELKNVEEGSNSEDEFSQMFDQISEFKLDLKTFEDDLSAKKAAGFLSASLTNTDTLTKSLERGRENVALLRGMVGKITTSNTFVGRKLSREVRFLQSRLQEVERKLKEHLEQESSYQALSRDCQVLQRQLEAHREEIESNRKCEASGDLRQYLTLLKKSMSDLSKFKKQLFQLNLGVHSLMGDLSNSASKEEDKASVEQVERLREEVVKLYAAWDMYNLGLSSGLTIAQENVNNVDKIKENISQFRKSLGKEEAKFLMSDDSGFSDSGSNGKFSGIKMEDKREHFEKMSFYVTNLFCSLPRDSPVVTDLHDALQDASSQLESLSQAFNKSKVTNQDSGSKGRWSRVRRYSAFCIMLLSLMGVLSLFMRADCCEHKNSYFLYPRFSYVNGPPPI